MQQWPEQPSPTKDDLGEQADLDRFETGGQTAPA